MAQSPKTGILGKSVFTAVAVAAYALDQEIRNPNYAYWLAAVLGIVWFDWLLIGAWRELLRRFHGRARR